MRLVVDFAVLCDQVQRDGRCEVVGGYDGVSLNLVNKMLFFVAGGSCQLPEEDKNKGISFN